MLKTKSMFQRKKVIFQIGKGNRIISEFNENTTVLYLKIYVRDRINIKKFDLYLKGNPIKNNNIPLYRFFQNKNDKIIKFNIKINNENNSEKINSINKDNNNIYNNRDKFKNKNKEKLKLYEEEISFVKERNNQLINNINKYKENISEYIKNESRNNEKCNSIENLLPKQKDKINLLKKEINDDNNKYKILKNKSVEKENRIKKNKLKYTESNDNFSIISKYQKPKRCLSIESFNAMYPHEKKNYRMKTINLSSENIKRNRDRDSMDSTNVLSSSMDYNNSQLKISTNNISNVKRNNSDDINENDLEVIKIDELQNSRNEKKKITKKDFNYNTNYIKKEIDHSPYYSNEKNQKEYKYQIKEYNTNYSETNNKNSMDTSKISQDSMDNLSIKEEDNIDFNKIMNEFNNKKNIKQILSKDDLLNKDNLKIPISYDTYFTVFEFLDKNEILSFSSVNKSNGISALYYWMNYLENKINYLNDNYKNLIEKYNSLAEKINNVESKPNNILSNFSKSGLKVLNSPHYLDIYNNGVDYFTKDDIFLFIYKMLFQFNKLYDSNNNISDNDFITLMLNEIKDKTKEKKSLKEYIYNLLDKGIEFSFETVIKAKNIMKKYNIDVIEGNRLAKIDRASAIIGHVIKDIMGFTGLMVKANISRKTSNSGPKGGIFEEDISFSSLKNKIIMVCEQISNERNKYENVVKKIKEIILKFYNI